MSARLSNFAVRLIAGVAALTLSASASAGATVYRVEDMGNVPGGLIGPTPNAINRYGVAVGTVALPDGSSEAIAFLLTAHKIPGVGYYSEAWGINRFATIVGASHRDARSSPQTGFVWKPDGSVSFLPNLYGPSGWSVARAVDDEGHVVGDCSSVERQQTACLWKGGVVTDLGIPEGAFAARAYSVVGHPLRIAIAGFGSDGIQRGYLWQAGQLQQLGTLASDGHSGSTEVYSLNRRGQIAGTSNTDTRRHAYRWSSEAGMEDLGTLTPDGYSFGMAINSGGTVVGEASMTPSYYFHAFIAHPGGKMQDLNTMLDPVSGAGWGLSIAVGINDAGQIIGTGAYNGLARAFRLTPMR